MGSVLANRSAQYLKDNYPVLQPPGVGSILDSSGEVSTDYIQGPLFDALKAKVTSVIGAGGVANIDTCENAPSCRAGIAPGLRAVSVRQVQ